MIQMDYYCPADSVHQLDQVCDLYVFMIGLGFRVSFTVDIAVLPHVTVHS